MSVPHARPAPAAPPWPPPDWTERLRGPIDLHTHSRESDGTQSPGDVIRSAARAGLGCVALTDHDTTVGWREAATVAAEVGVAFVPGVEFSAQLGPASVHVLGYGIDPLAASFVEERTRIRQERLDRAERMVEAIGRDYPLTWRHVQEASSEGATIGRPHIADALVTLGIVPDRSTAFEGILHWQGGYYQPHRAPSPEAAVRIIRDAGGAAVIAHPGARGRPLLRVPGALETLVDAGLNGLEIDHRDNDERDRRRLAAFAAAHDLIVTGSSDYHGDGKPNRLGEHTTAPHALRALVHVITGTAPVVPPAALVG